MLRTQQWWRREGCRFAARANKFAPPCDCRSLNPRPDCTRRRSRFPLFSYSLRVLRALRSQFENWTAKHVNWRNPRCGLEPRRNDNSFQTPMASNPSATNNDRWSLAEAVDLPIALEEERSSTDREKELAATRAELAQLIESSPHTAIVHAWLRRWQRMADGNTPGLHLEDSLRNAGRIALAVGLLAGLAAASDRLFFTGPEPLNVFALVGILVFAPLALSAILILTVSLRRPGQGTALQHFFIYLGRKVANFRERWVEHRAEPWRTDASWSAITRSLGRNSALLQAPVLAISQRLALGFGLGLLIMLYLRVTFWELSFGWQTTLTAPESVWHSVTTVISAPWSWFWPEATPSLQQIVSTRYSRLAGAAGVDPAMSRAWWPFLAATIVFWSILIRAAILVGLRVAQNRRLRRFDANLPDAELLARRLVPGWSTGGSEFQTQWKKPPLSCQLDAPQSNGRVHG